ncbi:MAG: hypothetical protein KDB80_06620 [Planctomycetes bacterium]|nr:hypothetical protein [Planctomycetota bacterium]
MKKVVVDTTARAVFWMEGDEGPIVIEVNEAMGRSLSVAKIEKAELPKATEVYTIKVKGLG